MTALEKAPTILTRVGARKLTDRIAQKLDSADADLARAWEGRVWEALEHASWEDWCAAELPDLVHIRLAIPTRQERVKALRLVGASERAIASATGVSPGTAHTDLQALRDRGELDDAPDSTESLDGRRRPAQRPAIVPEPERAPHGLTPLMHEAWQHVDSRTGGGLTCLELERKARWRHGRASSLLNRLERARLVERSGIFRDGYGVYVARPLD